MKNSRPLVVGTLMIALLGAAGVGLLVGRLQGTGAATGSTRSSQPPPPTTPFPLDSSGSPPNPPAKADVPEAPPTEPVRLDKPPALEAKVALVIKRFGKEFTKMDGGRNAWRTRLTPYATEDVQENLATVDPDHIPAGHFAEYEILELGPTEVAARVTYREGWSTVLYLITDGTDWRVFRYDRFEE